MTTTNNTQSITITAAAAIIETITRNVDRILSTGIPPVDQWNTLRDAVEVVYPHIEISGDTWRALESLGRAL